jgi:glutamate-1-semialdehyde 2,1-aminomutase
MTRVVAIVQARLRSARLPNKVLASIGGIPTIDLLVVRLGRARTLDHIVVATGSAESNRELIAHLECRGSTVFVGDERDVLARYLAAARATSADVIVRVTGDCPLVDPGLVDRVVERFFATHVDYASNIDPPTFPDGLDVEVFTVAALEEAAAHATDPQDREHVTTYMRTSTTLRRTNVACEHDESKARWTLDEPEDQTVLDAVVRHFAPRVDFAWTDVLALTRDHPELFLANRHLTRNAGVDESSGQKVWRRAQRVIAGGNMLLSKNPDMFLPGGWPAYFSRAAGCQVWDLDGRAYVDMSLMGVGTNTLGYGNSAVDEAVARVVRDGNMSTLNCREEVDLAERLVELNPWADSVRFARSGGEANAIAVRLARAASGRDVVAFCGYHGWHDWYLAANLGDEGRLAGHLLPGLQPAGVPRALAGTAIPFNFNDLEQLRRIVSSASVGVIKMEVARSVPPEPGFLEAVRSLADEHGIVLVFDECTSGFRETLGGLHRKYGVEPDVAMYGKTLGNGYAITAVVGRREVMDAAELTFVSSTFWTERIGPTAALATLSQMEAIRSWEVISRAGLRVREGWRTLASRHELKIRHVNLPALAGFVVDDLDQAEVKTYVAQEMLAQDYLAGTAVYSSTAHSDQVIDDYLAALGPVFERLAESQHGRPLRPLIRGPVARSGFARLN